MVRLKPSVEVVFEGEREILKSDSKKVEINVARSRIIKGIY